MTDSERLKRLKDENKFWKEVLIAKDEEMWKSNRKHKVELIVIQILFILIILYIIFYR